MITLYRKYRPRRFTDLIGQAAVNTTLQQALGKQRLSHAYLFSGPRGTGKTSTARILARAVTCLTPVQTEQKGGSFTYEPCNSCEHCLAILNNHTSDLIEIDAASNRGIEDIRDLREQIQYHPVQLNKKVYIIDEVHMLTNEAFNALLKTLEEPPEHALLILATTELHKVPLTIRSRCQLLRFEPGSVEDIQQALETVAQAENLAVEKPALTLLAEHAEGGFRDALTLLESLSTQHSPLTLALAEQALGILPEQQVAELLDSCFSGKVDLLSELLQQVEGRISGGYDRLLSQLINLVRQEQYHPHRWPHLSPSHLTYALQQLLEAYILQRSSPVPALPLQIACYNIATQNRSTEQQFVPTKPHSESVAFQPGIQAEAEKESKSQRPFTPPPSTSISKVTVTTKAAPAPTQVPVVELRQGMEAGSLKDPRKAWKEMIETVCRQNIALGQALKQAVFHTAEDGAITVYVRYKFHADKMNEKRNLALVKQILEQLTGQAWEVIYHVTDSLPRQHTPKAVSSGIEEAAAVFGNPPPSA